LITSTFSKKKEVFKIVGDDINYEDVMIRNGVMSMKKYKIKVNGSCPEIYEILFSKKNMNDVIFYLNRKYVRALDKEKVYKVYFIDNLTWYSPMMEDVRNGDDYNFIISLTFGEFNVKDISEFNYIEGIEKCDKIEEEVDENEKKKETIYSCDDFLFKTYSPFLDKWKNQTKPSGCDEKINKKLLCDDIVRRNLQNYKSKGNCPIFAVISGSSDIEIVKL